MAWRISRSSQPRRSMRTVFLLDYYFDVGTLMWAVEIDEVGAAIAYDPRSTLCMRRLRGMHGQIFKLV